MMPCESLKYTLSFFSFGNFRIIRKIHKKLADRQNGTSTLEANKKDSNFSPLVTTLKRCLLKLNRKNLPVKGDANSSFYLNPK